MSSRRRCGRCEAARDGVHHKVGRRRERRGGNGTQDKHPLDEGIAKAQQHDANGPPRAEVERVEGSADEGVSRRQGRALLEEERVVSDVPSRRGGEAARDGDDQQRVRGARNVHARPAVDDEEREQGGCECADEHRRHHAHDAGEQCDGGWEHAAERDERDELAHAPSEDGRDAARDARADERDAPREPRMGVEHGR